MNKDFDYDKWDDDFHNNRCINILDLISKEDMKTIRKLNIEVEEKIYTKYELEVLYLNLLEYYNDDIDEKELELLKPLGIIKNLDETEVEALKDKAESLGGHVKSFKIKDNLAEEILKDYPEIAVDKNKI